EQPSQPTGEPQPAYPPIGPDPTLPEGENGVETYPGQPPLLPVTTEFPSTTETFTEQTTSTAASGLGQYCQSPRGQYPSPNSCGNYINCWDDVAIEQECPSGLLFGETTCDYPQNVDCGDRPVPALEAPGSDGSSSGNGTSSQCPSSFGTYKSKKNCGAFVVCVAGEAYEFSCPGGTNYNDRLKVCDYPYRVDCGDLPPNPNSVPSRKKSEEGSSSGNGTSSQCPSSFGTYKSKKNCGAFVVCVAGEAYEFSCPGGTNYND
ncbi:protein obstructor-E-like, partial [Diaphorina citri]|uniref:Protein obstructor-E-like n=1 Tax=Diaphorina citri TaxID=121845 RepID=A0A1S3DS92_DIACI